LLIAVSFVVGLVLALAAAALLRRRAPAEPEEIAAEHEYSGVFVAHWEVARFCVLSGRRCFGLLPRVELW